MFKENCFYYSEDHTMEGRIVICTKRNNPYERPSCIDCDSYISHSDAKKILENKLDSIVIRCKNCKHRPKEPNWPTYENGNDLEFPDQKCPCQCVEDGYYSWYPSGNWFCANGEAK